MMALLEGGPRTGYELLQDLGRVFGEDYRPSPGSVYPAVNALVGERLVVSAANGRGKELRLSAAGRQVLDRRRDALADIEARTGALLGVDSSYAPVLARVAARLARFEGRVPPAVVEEALTKAVGEIESIGGSDG